MKLHMLDVTRNWQEHVHEFNRYNASLVPKARAGRLLAGARRVFVPTQDTAKRLGRYGPIFEAFVPDEADPPQPELFDIAPGGSRSRSVE